MNTALTRPILLTAVATLALGLSSTAQAYGKNDAIHDCESRLRSEYGLSDLRDATAIKLNDSDHHYQVQGLTKIDGRKHPWDCEIKNRHVTSISYDGPKEKGMNGSQKLAIGAAAAIAAGVLASKMGAGETTNTDRQTYPDTGNDATFNDEATASLPCSMNKPSHNKQCPASVTRGQSGAATVRVTNPSGVQRTLRFKQGDVTTPDGGELDWGRQGDNWFIGIDNREFYIVPDAFVMGG